MDGHLATVKALGKRSISLHTVDVNQMRPMKALRPYGTERCCNTAKVVRPYCEQIVEASLASCLSVDRAIA